MVCVLSTLSTRGLDTEQLHELFDTEQLHDGVPVDGLHAVSQAEGH